MKNSYLNERHPSPSAQCNKTAFTLLALLVAATMLLCSCSASKPAVVWDPIFVDELHLDEDMMHVLGDSVQTVDQTSVRENSTVRIRQIVSDALTIHIALEITFGPAIDMEDPNFDAVLLKGNVTPPASMDDLKKGDTLRDLGLDAIPLGGGMHLQTIEIDSESRTSTYLISFHSDLKAFEGDKLTLLIGSFTVYKEKETDESNSVLEPDFIYPDLHAFSFHPQNKAPILEFKIIADDGKEHGYVLASPFSFVVDVYSPKYASAEQVRKPIEFVMRDGTVENIRNYGSAGGGNSSSCSFLFSKPLDIENVKAIHIGDLTFAVN